MLTVVPGSFTQQFPLFTLVPRWNSSRVWWVIITLMTLWWVIITLIAVYRVLWGWELKPCRISGPHDGIWGQKTSPNPSRMLVWVWRQPQYQKIRYIQMCRETWIFSQKTLEVFSFFGSNSEKFELCCPQDQTLASLRYHRIFFEVFPLSLYPHITKHPWIPWKWGGKITF